MGCRKCVHATNVAAARPPGRRPGSEPAGRRPHKRLDRSCLTVLAGSCCDVAMVAYEMTLLVSRTGDVLTPGLRAELQAALPP